MSHCEIHGDRLAIGQFVWGLYSEFNAGRGHQRAFFCHDCADDLWEGCRGPVMSMIMHFVIEKPTGINDYRRDWVEHRAYFKWLTEGRPEGQDIRHWFEAQGEYRDEVLGNKEGSSQAA